MELFAGKAFDMVWSLSRREAGRQRLKQNGHIFCIMIDQHRLYSSRMTWYQIKNGLNQRWLVFLFLLVVWFFCFIFLLEMVTTLFVVCRLGEVGHLFYQNLFIQVSFIFNVIFHDINPEIVLIPFEIMLMPFFLSFDWFSDVVNNSWIKFVFWCLETMPTGWWSNIQSATLGNRKLWRILWFCGNVIHLSY